ncbi:(6-4)DNA photolyase [Bienertia sinuspersici]
MDQRNSEGPSWNMEQRYTDRGSWNIKKVCFEYDTDPYYRALGARVEEYASQAGIEVFSPVSHTLFDPRVIIDKNGGNQPLSYQSFLKVAGQPAWASSPVSTGLSSIPPPGDVGDIQISDVPTIAELGYADFEQHEFSPFKGGESEALERLKQSLYDKEWVAKFEKPKGDPSSSLKPATTVLSPYLKFGCLSSRYFYQCIQEIYNNVKHHTSPPVSLLGQLLWRDFFYTAAFGTPNFDQMRGNSICKQIPWNEDDELLAAWRDGRTGYPWIDACMIQADMPKEYIYEPWTAPKNIQVKAKCIIGKDYPSPVVSHDSASKECKRKMAEAYKLNRETNGFVSEDDLRKLRQKLEEDQTQEPTTKRQKLIK